MTWNGYMGYYAEKGLKQAFKNNRAIQQIST